MTIWEELGISRTNDMRQIKKAYAEKSKLVHPEEHPEAFRRLHEAYREAVNIARFQSNAVKFQDNSEKSTLSEQLDFSKTETLKALENDESGEIDFNQVYQEHSNAQPRLENEFDFDGVIKRNDLKHNNEIMEKTEIIMRKMSELYNRKKFADENERSWLNIFDTDLFYEIRYEPIFMQELCLFFKTYKLYDTLANALYKCTDFSEVLHLDESGEIEVLYDKIIAIKAKQYKYFDDVLKLCRIAAFVFMVMTVLLIAYKKWEVAILTMISIAFFAAAFILIRKGMKKFYDRNT